MQVSHASLDCKAFANYKYFVSYNTVRVYEVREYVYVQQLYECRTGGDEHLVLGD